MLLALQAGLAQKKAAPNPATDPRRILAQKAQALETRGRPDMAVQLWQQILLSDPNNAEALAGLARDYKLGGLSQQAADTLERLKRVNPSDPNISKIQALSSNTQQNDQLRHAGELARQGKADEAMRVYRELYGDHPPDGDIALAYYQTMYGTASGKEAAVVAMRALASRNPGDPRFAVELGRMLTYDARTRSEGIRILQEHSKDPIAQAAVRQALVWDSANPQSAGELRQYLKEHPQDQELTSALKQNEGKLSQMNSGIARTPAEKAAFAALNAHRMEDAETRFTELLEQDPNNGRVAAGMGFLRMQQSNFGGAISYLSQAEQNGYKDRAVLDGLATSRFWFTMGEASQAFDQSQFDVATAKYREALVMRPRSVEALNGLAGLLTKEQQYTEAAGVYEQLLRIQPGNTDASRGLFLAYARDNQPQKALAVMGRFPASVKSALTRDPEYLRTMATLYHAQGRETDAQRVLAQALALPFPENGTTLKADTRMQYAGILMEAKRYDQAQEMYTQILNEDAGNLSAWMGLVSAHHELKQDNQAIADVEKMPPATYEAALSDPGFLSMLGSIYQQANQFEIAQGLLERSAKIQIAAGGQPALGLQLQLASIYLQRNNTDQAYAIYRQVLEAHPDRVEAWKGLIGTLQATNHSTEALAEIALIPPAVRKELETDIEFVQSEASMYASAGDTAHAIEYMNRVQSHYQALRASPPAAIEVQNAWLLYNTKNDRALYPALMRLGSRQDLTIPQRETVQTIWADWSVRRAGIAIDNNNLPRAMEILEAANQAFPDNMDVRKAIAGGYLKAGQAKEALAMFKQVPMQDASAADFQGAIGAALAANDKATAEQWLRQALDRFPRSAAILSLAARFEQARGDNQRAAEYWRASLAAMPDVSPQQKLAHELVYPEEVKGTRQAKSPADLQRLLNPDEEPFQKTTKLPPLPAYGQDPYGGSAPVVPTARPQGRSTLPSIFQPASPQYQPAPLQNPTALQSQSPLITAPTSTVIQLPPDPTTRTRSLPAPVSPRPSTVSTGSSGMGSYGQPEASGASRPTAAHKPSAARTARKPARDSSGKIDYTGRMHLPASEENINTTDAPAVSTPAAPAQTTPGWTPQARLSAPEPAPTDGLRIAAQPMNATAARAQALFAEQTDGQLTQGSATGIHSLSNARVSGPGRAGASSANYGQYTSAQYTPSAQEAATGAYSAPKQTTPDQQQQPQPQPAAQQPAEPQPLPPVTGEKPKRPRKARSTGRTERVPTLVTAPGTQTDQQPNVTDAPPATTPATTDKGLTDEELQDRNLPPLRGPWVRVQRDSRVLSPRDEAEMQLRGIESGYSPWLGGTGSINYRSGALGYDHLSALESPFEVSMPLGFNARLTVVARPVFLDSGQADGTSTIQETTTTSQATVTVVPQPLGTDLTTDVSPTIPPRQNAVGIGGEIQLAFQHMALAAGYTPSGFLVANATGRFQWKPGNGPFTFSFTRDSVKDTQLSYSGLRDPGQASATSPGPVWGGVMANQGNVQYARGDLQSGFYLGAGGQYLTGHQVLTNTRFDGSAGAYWHIWTVPEYGNLSIGANFFAMHYAHNEQAFTYGNGGYYSPQAYFLANVPFTWSGHYLTRLHYNILGSLGVQAFQVDLTPLFPLDPTRVEALPAQTSVGPNYDLRGQAAYAIGPHWFVGGALGANNSRNYTSINAGFFIRYLFRPQPSTVATPTGLFPTDGLRPFTVP